MKYSSAPALYDCINGRSGELESGDAVKKARAAQCGRENIQARGDQTTTEDRWEKFQSKAHVRDVHGSQVSLLKHPVLLYEPIRHLQLRLVILV